MPGILYLVVGGVLIFACSKPFINSVVSAANTLDVNPILLAFFLAPVASEMPEILESISLSRKGSIQNINIAFANLVGGTVAKTSLLTGIFCIFGAYRNYAWHTPTYPVSLGLLGACAGSAAAVGYFVRRQRAYHGLFLWACFLFSAVVQYSLNRGKPVPLDL